MLAHKGTKTITTDRLILRRYKLNDVHDMFANYANDDNVTRFLSWASYKREDDIVPILTNWIEAYERDNFYHWAIEYENSVIGGISAVEFDELNCSYELGYCIGQKFWNMGIMTEAAKAALEFLFTEVNMHRVTAKHDIKNPASGEVMKKCGMRCEGTYIGHYLRRDGDISDAVVYAILKDEWEIQKEIAYYNALPVRFENFIAPPILSDGEIELVCTEKKPGIPEKRRVPAYIFEIRRTGERVGEINLRIGYVDSLYYGGQIGYSVDEPHRGHGYAEKGCRLLAPVMKAHGMTKAIITNDHTNIASKRTCEKLGARLVRVARLPEWHDLYKEGQRFVNIFEWSLK